MNIVKLTNTPAVLKRRITARKRRHRAHRDLDLRLLVVTMKKLTAEKRWERKQGKSNE